MPKKGTFSEHQALTTTTMAIPAGAAVHARGRCCLWFLSLLPSQYEGNTRTGDNKIIPQVSYRVPFSENEHN